MTETPATERGYTRADVGEELWVYCGKVELPEEVVWVNKVIPQVN